MLSFAFSPFMCPRTTIRVGHEQLTLPFSNSLFQLLFLLLSSAETAYMRRKPRAAT